MTENSESHAASQPFKYDVFVSYSRADREKIALYVERFERAKLRVWWDKNIDEGSWGDEVEAAIQNSRRVVVFVSKNSVESGYVFVEARRGREQKKLIPVRIDQAPLKFSFEGLLALIQQWSLHDLVDWDADPRLAHLCEVCRGEAGPAPPAVDEETPSQRVRAWLDRVEDTDAIAEALAVAVLEFEPYATVLAAAEPLKSALRGPVSPEKPVPISLAKLTRGRDATLHAIEAVVFPVKPPRLKMNIDCVRFEEEGRSHALLRLIWETVDGLRPHVATWLDGLARHPDISIRYRVAVAVGVLAQCTFPSVFDGLIGPWALEDAVSARQTADLALSVAALAPDVEDAVGSVLIKDWSAESASVKQARAALEFACGSTGLRLTEQAILVLKRIVQREQKRLLADARRAIGGLVAAACTSSEDGLFDLPNFLSALVDWAEEPPGGDLPSYVPMSLFLSALGSLPPSDADGGPSLQRLIESRRKLRGSEGVAAETVLNACARAFKTALARREERDMAQKVLRDWAEYQHDHEVEPDPVLALARAMVALSPVGSRDRQRIEFLFRGFYHAILLENSPQLTGTAQ